MLSCLQAVERRYPRGAYILHAGQEVRALALLVRGTAHIQKEDFWGNRSLLASLAAGDIFAEAYAMPGSGTMRNDVVAVEDCTVLRMDVERVLSRLSLIHISCVLCISRRNDLLCKIRSASR